MRNKAINTALVVAVVVIFITGAYMLLRPPAQKPAPTPPVPAPAPEPIPGVPQFDAGKYPAEPQVRVYLADKGYVTTMALEKYIEGVIAQEMKPDWPPEALAAQAIVSRTLTVNAIEAGTIKQLHNADVSTSKEELQAYAPEKVNDSVRQAVKRTRGMILLYAGGLVNAIYSSCNGQISATREESFPVEIPYPTPYFQPVADDCYEYAPDDIKTWTIEIPGSEVAAAIGYQGSPGDIQILKKGPSGRILYIGAGDKKMYGAEFRRAIGYDRLKSTLITEMTYDGSTFTFKGQGWGNGVGLCQWGAYTYAKHGVKAEDIIKHYYPGVEIKKIWQ
ncbi:MAG TPA: SpoIID/LytB domain-containing protein [Methylomusa anaerophila]|uniref:Amidase enhancer n=1 Tax=Methylomusa anaerophila TaxID=1930071 RepID=A0A348AJF9_9FIRM|nr:SpoIID/LytB domain-containing protein [Methylomusa anaerophila]BBB91207.1 amidase enhancer precursor [Methylomusa anaerophila]HML89798.1 SpoIID/LytB domain-containing protein [Methylomusa anaerophila]